MSLEAQGQTYMHGSKSCAVLMMSSVKSYFDYRRVECLCGIPSVTLKEERADWEKLLAAARSSEPSPGAWQEASHLGRHAASDPHAHPG
ncbi:hypothetical protein L227DRAFT_610351 [Lentinus tigrinus ALCF2SS1-6]|uniref:Uncharacterized protein n=1 Tax=Lentinus tigrinus ALCF2SS1-6 TaxID=1328759 RepID=A0A5C2SDQ4_9APHY|nr:hypothetical protein L227DRAFT_610351 [Lentinus tigrinus ALCF2SS1-6]